ncbi:hypothetical protein Clacol_002340 [Clathrus columnatus]|uniref:Uncharacterized protein n=1 Tax=Clathrus columnatus TaxID=1419009 RepID=A0AAV5A0I1_9AGAM|nr:hypothetical protein Clacol_002340 [Clathrus columnatus]
MQYFTDITSDETSRPVDPPPSNTPLLLSNELKHFVTMDELVSFLTERLLPIFTPLPPDTPPVATVTTTPVKELDTFPPQNPTTGT